MIRVDAFLSGQELDEEKYPMTHFATLENTIYNRNFYDKINENAKFTYVFKAFYRKIQKIKIKIHEIFHVFKRLYIYHNEILLENVSVNMFAYAILPAGIRPPDTANFRQVFGGMGTPRTRCHKT